jgi:hypothetical protein
MPVNELVELKKQIAELQSKGLVTPLVSLLLLQCSYSAWMKYKFGLVWIRIPVGEMEEFKFCYHGPRDPIQEFWRFYEAELGLAPTT